jgi:hypothetical protein
MTIGAPGPDVMEKVIAENKNIWKKIKKNACNLFWFVIVCTRKTDVRNIRTPG